MKPPRKKWFVYILECRDGTFYTGITTNLERRERQHNDGKGARYTRMRRPVMLLYSERCKNRSEASIREAELKSLSRADKKKAVLAFTKTAF